MDYHSDLDTSVADFRRQCLLARLSESDIEPDPLAQFAKWFDDALRAQLPQPHAMTLATATIDGQPSARMVLLKGFDPEGFVFYSNYESQKGRELAHNAKAALVFYWAELSRQVRITGQVSRVTAQESDAYWRTRPVGSRLGALVSQQSVVIQGREVLETRLKRLLAVYQGGDIPRPAYWGGYRVSVDSIEFWHSRENRLHDRLRYTRLPGDRWQIKRLSP